MNNRFSVIFILVMIVSQAPILQAGPPLITDDPGTPGDGNWEINIGFTIEKLKTETSYEAPILDINYGLGERLQLKYEVPWLILDEEGAASKNGLGNSEIGLKYRFLDEEQHGVSMSIYPQLSFNNPTSSDERGLVDSGMELLIPFQLSKDIGSAELLIELGYNLIEHDKDEWIYGLATGWQLTKSAKFVAEINGVTKNDFEENVLVFNIGGILNVHKNINLLFSAGRSFRESSETQPGLIGYLGFQFNF